MDAGLVKFLHRKEKNVNYRTATHNVLMKNNDQYDAQYYAVLLCQSKLQALYSTVMRSLIKETIEKIVNNIREVQLVDHVKASRTVVTLSGWSMNDRRNAVDMYRSAACTEAIVAECEGHCYESASSIIDEIQSCLRLNSGTISNQPSKRQRIGKHSAESSASQKIDIENIILSASFAEYTSDDNIIANKHPVVAVLMRNSEKLSSSVFGNLVESLETITSIRFVFILDQFAACAVPVPSDCGHRHMVEIDLSQLPTCWEFYESMILPLLSMSILPVRFTPSLWMSIHREFDDGDRCISSLLSRISLYIWCHFRCRQALLSVSGESKLMTELKFLNPKHKGTALKQKKAIQALLKYTCVEDLRDSGLIEQDDPLSLPSENEIYCAIRELNQRSCLDGLVLQLVHFFRDSLVPSAEHAALPIVEMWIDIQSPDCLDNVSSMIYRFCDTIKNYFFNAGVTTLRNILAEWKNLLSCSRYRSKFECDDDPSNTSSLSPVSMMSICSDYLISAVVRIEDLEYVLDEVCQLLKTWPMCSQNNINFCDSFKSISKKLPEVEHKDDLAVLRTEVVSADRCPGWPLRIDDLLFCLVTDIHESFVELLRGAVKLSRPCSMTGIVTIAPSAISGGHFFSNSNIRKTFSDTLMKPQQFLGTASDVNIPDVSTLHEVLKTFDRGGSMLLLFDSFSQFSTTWDVSSPEKLADTQEKKAKLDRKGAAQIDAALKKDHLKCRFLSAVYDLQKAGVMKVTNNGKSFQKTAMCWIYD